MTEIDTIRTFYRFNAQVRESYLEAILALPPEERLKDRGASYPSLLEIHGHILDSLRFWFELVPRDRVAEAGAEEIRVRDLSAEQWRAATVQAADTVEEFLRPLSAADLSREIVVHFPAADSTAEERFLVGDMLWHMIEEEFQHRGELNALLWQMDVEPPLGSLALWNASKTPGMYRP